MAPLASFKLSVFASIFLSLLLLGQAHGLKPTKVGEYDERQIVASLRPHIVLEKVRRAEELSVLPKSRPRPNIVLRRSITAESDAATNAAETNSEPAGAHYHQRPNIVLRRSDGENLVGTNRGPRPNIVLKKSRRAVLEKELATSHRRTRPHPNIVLRRSTDETHPPKFLAPNIVLARIRRSSESIIGKDSLHETSLFQEPNIVLKRQSRRSEANSTPRKSFIDPEIVLRKKFKRSKESESSTKTFLNPNIVLKKRSSKVQQSEIASRKTFLTPNIVLEKRGSAEEEQFSEKKSFLTPDIVL